MSSSDRPAPDKALLGSAVPPTGAEPALADDPASRGSGWRGWALGLVLGLEALVHGLELLLGPWSRMHWEELFNARAGVQLACGHFDAVHALQYRTFCGGCTGEAVLAVPLFLTLGPSVLVWKALVAAFHLAITALGGLVLRRLISERAAVAFVLLIFAAPGWYLELSHTGWGNHLESTLFPLAAVLLLAWAEHGSWPRRLGALALAGAIAGLGLWFGQTSAWALPALGLGALWVGRWAAPLFALGAGIGMLPWYAYYRERPGATDATLDWWTGRELASPAAMWDWLGGPWLRAHIWDPSIFGPSGRGPGLYWGVLWGLALLGLGRITVQMIWGRDRPSRVLGWFLPVSLATLLVVYWLRYDLWSNLPDPYVNGAFNLRYRTPLVPILALSAAVAVAWPWRRPALRLLLPALGLALVLYGGARRLGLWGMPNLAVIGRGVYQHDGWPDKTVPLGQPPQPLRREQGRATDVRAARVFLEDHSDALADCSLDHAYELGRRLGLRAAKGADAELATLVGEAWPVLADESERWLAAQGLARGLIKDSGETVPHFVAVLDLLDATVPGLGARVGRAAGVRAHGAFFPDQDEQSRQQLDPRVSLGVCEGRGGALLQSLSEQGGRPPQPFPEERAVDILGSCPREGAFSQGVAWHWAEVQGCEEADLAALEDWLGRGVGDRDRQAWAAGCAQLRR